MRYLLDTHTFVWFVLNDPGLSPNASAAIRDPASDLLISPASYWEMAIKVSTGKMILVKPLLEFMDDHLSANDIDILPVEVRHADHVSRMPFYHKDPFDRLIAAQSLVEKLPVISVDSVLDQYGVTRFW